MGKLRLSRRGRGFVCGVALLAFASLGYARTAQANMAFPAELQKQLEERFPGKKFCVPLCTACHTLTTGGPDHYNAFGKALYDAGLNVPSVAKLDTVLTELLDKNLDSDGDGKSDNDELKDFEAPGFYGSAAFCTDLTYGCGARIASAPPPVDRLALFSAGFVVLGLAALRRQRRLRKAT